MLQMKIFLAKAWIQLCILLWCIVMCLCTSPVRIMGTEKREVTVFFNNNGTLMDFSTLPKCESGGKINLLEYSYGQMECPSVSADDCTVVRNDALLPDEELLLHEECSLLDICTTLWFPTRLATLENKINAMTIKFQCTDPTDTFLDMCEKRNLTFRNTLHLTLGDRTHFRDCRCWVNQGTFTTLLNDIRLTQKKGSECSPAELVIGDNRLSCNGTKQKGFGSVFHETNQNIPTVGLYVSLISTLEDISPDMVWLIIHPQETCHIECEGDKSSQQHAPDTATTTSKVGQNTLTSLSTVTSSTQTYAGTTGIGESTADKSESTADKSESTADKSDSNSWNTINTILHLIVISLLISLLVFQIVKRKTSKQQGPQKPAEVVRTTDCRTPCDAIPDGRIQNRSSLILKNKEDVTDQINKRTNEEPGQHQNNINARRYLQPSENTNKDTSSYHLPEEQGHMINRGTHLDEPMPQSMHQQDPQQKIAARKYSQMVTGNTILKAPQSTIMVFPSTGEHSRQISEMYCNKALSSLPVQLPEDVLSDNGKDAINIPLLNQSLNSGNALAAIADNSSQVQTPVSKTKQKSDSHSDESSSLLSEPTTDTADTDMASLLPEDRTAQQQLTSS